jgi:hypothetical protein
MGPLLVVGPIVLWLLVTGPFALYPLARWRVGATDKQLGLKFALEYFRMLAFQLGLFGSVIVLYTLFSKMPSDDKGDVYRVGFGFFVPAALLFAAHLRMLASTNQKEQPGTRRLFGGYNLVVTGLVGMTSLVIAFQALFTKGSSGDMGRLAVASLLVYGGAWGACLGMFVKLVREDRTAPPAPPLTRVEPAPAPVPPPQSGLPSLGGGAFPPVDR